MPLTTQPKRIFFAQTLGLAAAPMVHAEESASCTYTAGAFVIDDDAGLLDESTSPLASTTEAARTMGMALTAATGVTSANADIIWAGPYTVFEGTLSNATAGTCTLAQTHKWHVYPITKASSNWYLDANAVSDIGGGLVIGFKDPIGTVDARVYFIVTSTVRGGSNASSAAW